MVDIISDTRSAKTPWHLWVVGVVSLLWNGFGAYDFVMSTTQGDAYFRASGMSEAMIAYFHAMPGWMMVPWVMGVWGAVIGSVLLLLRMKLATPVFAVSLVGAVVSMIYQYALSNGIEVAGGMAVMPAIIAAIAAFLVWYAWAMAKRGVLR